MKTGIDEKTKSDNTGALEKEVEKGVYVPAGFIPMPVKLFACGILLAAYGLISFIDDMDKACDKVVENARIYGTISRDQLEYMFPNPHEGVGNGGALSKFAEFYKK